MLSTIAGFAQIVCVVGIFSLYAGNSTPDVNESHYLTKAKHFWDASFAPGDLFLDSGNAHWFFYKTIGVITCWLEFPSAAWLGRLLGWLLLALGWCRFAACFGKNSWYAGPVTAPVWVAAMHWGHLSGEWVVGGCESKVFAYGCAFLGLAKVVSGQWKSSWVWFGCSTAFHVLTGGWITFATLCVYAYLLGRNRLLPSERPRNQAFPLAIGGLLALFGIVPVLLLNQGVETAVLEKGYVIYVFQRLSHHLSPLHFASDRWWHFGTLFTLTVTLLGVARVLGIQLTARDVTSESWLRTRGGKRRDPTEANRDEQADCPPQNGKSSLPGPGLMKTSEDKELGEILEGERHTNDGSLLPGTPGRRAGDEGALFPSDLAPPPPTPSPRRRGEGENDSRIDSSRSSSTFSSGHAGPIALKRGDGKDCVSGIGSPPTSFVSSLSILCMLTTVISLVAAGGWLIDFCLSSWATNWSAALLRFYWFRWNDVLWPSLFAVTILSIVERQPTNSTWQQIGFNAILLGTLIIPGARLIATKVDERERIKLSPADRSTLVMRHESPAEQAKVCAHWMDACQWIRSNTPENSLVLTPRFQQTFKWYAHRAEIASWKDAPQDVLGLLEWERRMLEIYPRSAEGFGIEMSDEHLLAMYRKYHMNYVVLDRRIQKKPPLLPLVYSNANYAVFELSELSAVPDRDKQP